MSIAFSVDEYLDRRLIPEKYDCRHLVCEAWRDLTGEDLAARLGLVMAGPGERRVDRAMRRGFRRLDAPESPCIVIMQAHRRQQPHVALYLRGKVLHLQKHGVEFMPLSLAMRGFKSVKFYQ